MEYKTVGKILKGVGGLYTIKLADTNTHDKYFDTPSILANKTVFARGGGAIRHDKMTLLVGDTVKVVYSDKSIDSEDENDIRISEILERKNSLIRPPMANLDILFISLSSSFPTPDLTLVDKLTAIAENSNIEPIIIVGKSDLDVESAEKIRSIYEKIGYKVFVVSALKNEGVEEVKNYIKDNLKGKTAAFAGESGVGKSTLMTKLFPKIDFKTDGLSQKVQRGKNTTRQVELFAIDDDENTGYIADTPGFSLIDFDRFDFFPLDNLVFNMKEFSDYLGLCKYSKCSHTKEEGCAILKAVNDGLIPKSRHDSYVDMFTSLKNKKKW